jgi:hypothetical protein
MTNDELMIDESTADADPRRPMIVAIVRQSSMPSS